tara:strand:+ start:559 stop:786 length:228 start_codon:yes stop_codon:yes gene_type:complete
MVEVVEPDTTALTPLVPQAVAVVEVKVMVQTCTGAVKAVQGGLVVEQVLSVTQAAAQIMALIRVTDQRLPVAAAV